MSNAFCCCFSPCQESNEIATNMPEVQSMQQVEDLIAYINQLMSKTGGQQQAPRPESVAAFIDCGRNLIDKLSKRLNWHVSKKCLLSALHRETRNAVFQVVNQAELVPYLGMALGVIAHVWERAEQASSNKDKCLGLLREMSILAEHMKSLEIHLHQAKLNDILVFIVKGTLMCARQMETHSICRFIFAPLDAADLENLKSELQRSYPDLQLTALTEILNRLPATPGPSQPGQYQTNAVGMEEVENKVINLLDLTDELSRKVVVIYGVGGIGKTTLATKVLSRLPLTGYESCRVDMEQDPKTSDLLRMQEQILRVVFQKHLKLDGCTQGREELSKAFAQASNPVFLFMDNVLRGKDLRMLLPIEQLSMLPMSSRIFVTTRNLNEINILRCRGAFEVCSYNVAPLLKPEAKRLLCHYALGDEMGSFNPGVDMDRLLRICGGIPLVLQIVGSKLDADGNTVSACNAILEYFEKWIQNGMEGGEESEIIVDFVYKGFKEASKEAFLDVVFFFNDWERSRVADIVGEVELQDLERTALVTTTQWDDLKIHDIVKARGRRLSEGNRITDRESLSILLSDEEKLKQTKGIWFPRITRWDELDEEDCMMMIEAKQVDLMSRSLRVLSLGNEIRINGRCLRPFADLMFLDISYEDLLPIDLSKSRQLVYFKSSSMKGNGFPQLPPSSRLVHLDLNGCSMLERIPEGFENLTSLKILRMNNCSKLERLPERFGNLSSLQNLEMTGCSNLKRLPESFGDLSSLRELIMKNCSKLDRLPDKFGRLSSLQELEMNDCSNLKSLSKNFGDISSMVNMTLCGCSMLESLPESFGSLSSLRELKMTDLSKLERLPESFGKLSSMLQLELNGCFMLERLPGSFGNLSSLQQLKMNDCSKLERFPENFGNLSSMRQLELIGCSIPESFGNLPFLKRFKVHDCSKLQLLPQTFDQLTSLQWLEIDGGESAEKTCDIFCNIGRLKCLKFLSIRNCKEVKTLPDDIKCCTSLAAVKAYGCPELDAKAMDSLVEIKSLMFLEIGESPMLIKRWKEIQQEDRPLIGAVLRFENSINTWREIMSTMFFSAGSRFVQVDGDGKLAPSSFPDVGVEVCLLLTPFGLPDEVRKEVLEVTSQLQTIYVDVDVDVEEEAEGSRWMEERDMRIREMLLQLPEGSRAWTSPFFKTSLLFTFSLLQIIHSWSLSYTPYASVVGTSVLVDEEGRKQLSPSKMIFQRNMDDIPFRNYSSDGYHVFLAGICGWMLGFYS